MTEKDERTVRREREAERQREISIGIWFCTHLFTCDIVVSRC